MKIKENLMAIRGTVIIHFSEEEAMSIMWRYLDKRSATIAAIKDYESMQFIIENTDKKIEEEREKMTGLGSPNMDGMPHAYNPTAAEDRILKGIEEIDILKERYRQAVEYMGWFEPAWEKLSDDDRYCLVTFYSEENTYGSSSIRYIEDYFHVEHTAAYKRKNRALDRLTVLLFGR